MAWLPDFRGKLQADAYAGYDAFYATGHVLEIGCMAHARRRFVDAFAQDRAAALTIALMQQLYQVERASAGLTPDERRARRQEPLLAQLKADRLSRLRLIRPMMQCG